MGKHLATLLAAAALLPASACMRHNVETTSEVKPIHIVLDINVKVDKALDSYFVPPQGGDANVIPESVSYEEAIKPSDPGKIPPKEQMMGRFIARRAEMKKLKADGIVGEDTKGYLQFVKESKAAEGIVATENGDRKIVYEQIAKAQGSTPEKVAKAKAEKNANAAKPGEYLMDATGRWVVK